MTSYRAEPKALGHHCQCCGKLAGPDFCDDCVESLGEIINPLSRLDQALCGVKAGAGWVNPSATVTRNGDLFLIRGFVEGRRVAVLSTFASESMAPMNNLRFTPLREKPDGQSPTTLEFKFSRPCMTTTTRNPPGRGHNNKGDAYSVGQYALPGVWRRVEQVSGGAGVPRNKEIGTARQGPMAVGEAWREGFQNSEFRVALLRHTASGSSQSKRLKSSHHAGVVPGLGDGPLVAVASGLKQS
jgi:hypothetical protein